jgi:hypothetical protein
MTAYTVQQTSKVPTSETWMGQCNLEQYWLERTEVRVSVPWSTKMSQDLKEHSWMAKHWSSEVQDIPGCTWLAQVSKMLGTIWNSRALTAMQTHRCSQEMLQPCPPNDEKDPPKQTLPSPRSIYQVHQVLAQISGNIYTGHEQCTYHKVTFYKRQSLTKNALDGTLPWEAISASTGVACCCKLTSERKQWQRYCMGAKDDTPTLVIHTRNVGALECSATWQTIRIFLNGAKCRNQWRNHEKLYTQVDVFAAEDCWYFDVPLMLWLCKPLQSRRWWLINARILANKSEQPTMIGQMTLNQHYPHLPSTRTVTNGTLERIASARQYIQTSLSNLWNPQWGDGWKISPSCLLWLGICLLYLHWCRQPSLYSCQKM